MRPLRETNGRPLTDDDYVKCQGLHPTKDKPLATYRVCCYNNALLYPGEVVYMCEYCSEHRLKSHREIFNYVEIEEVGKTKKRRM